MRCARSAGPDADAEVRSSWWMSGCDRRADADCTDIRLSWRRYTEWSANPLKLTTLAGLGVEGTEASGVRKGSRGGGSPWPPSDAEGEGCSVGMKKLVEGRGGASVPEVEGREDDGAECPDELEGLEWDMLERQVGVLARGGRAYNDMEQARWLNVERAHRTVSVTARGTWKN